MGYYRVYTEFLEDFSVTHFFFFFWYNIASILG